MVTPWLCLSASTRFRSSSSITRSSGSRKAVQSRAPGAPDWDSLAGSEEAIEYGFGEVVEIDEVCCDEELHLDHESSAGIEAPSRNIHFGLDGSAQMLPPSDKLAAATLRHRRHATNINFEQSADTALP